MINLLEETIDEIIDINRDPRDIIFIGSAESGHQCTWEEFCILADFQYDNGFGAQEIAKDLIIVFSDGGIMRRSEYDGAECWEFHEPFVMPIDPRPIKNLNDSCYSSLSSMNPQR